MHLSESPKCCAQGYLLQRQTLRTNYKSDRAEHDHLMQTPLQVNLMVRIDFAVQCAIQLMASGMLLWFS